MHKTREYVSRSVGQTDAAARRAAPPPPPRGTNTCEPANSALRVPRSVPVERGPDVTHALPTRGAAERTRSSGFGRVAAQCRRKTTTPTREPSAKHAHAHAPPTPNDCCRQRRLDADVPSTRAACWDIALFTVFVNRCNETIQVLFV